MIVEIDRDLTVVNSEFSPDEALERVYAFFGVEDGQLLPEELKKAFLYVSGEGEKLEDYSFLVADVEEGALVYNRNALEDALAVLESGETDIPEEDAARLVEIVKGVLSEESGEQGDEEQEEEFSQEDDQKFYSFSVKPADNSEHEIEGLLIPFNESAVDKGGIKLDSDSLDFEEDKEYLVYYNHDTDSPPAGRAKVFKKEDGVYYKGVLTGESKFVKDEVIPAYKNRLLSHVSAGVSPTSPVVDGVLKKGVLRNISLAPEPSFSSTSLTIKNQELAAELQFSRDKIKELENKERTAARDLKIKELVEASKITVALSDQLKKLDFSACDELLKFYEKQDPFTFSAGGIGDQKATVDFERRVRNIAHCLQRPEKEARKIVKERSHKK